MKKIALLSITLSLVGCHTDMWRQAKVKTFEESPIFQNGAASRERVSGVIPHKKLKEDNAFYTGYENGKLVKQLPVKLTPELLKKGQERFNIFCTHCHGVQGYGNGMITQRGLELARTPANYHTDRLKNMPIGHYFDVITNGYGIMYPFADRITPEERWAIAAYIKVLQRSQQGSLSDVPLKEQQKIQGYQKISPQGENKS